MNIRGWRWKSAAARGRTPLAGARPRRAARLRRPGANAAADAGWPVRRGGRRAVGRRRGAGAFSAAAAGRSRGGLTRVAPLRSGPATAVSGTGGRADSAGGIDRRGGRVRRGGPADRDGGVGPGGAGAAAGQGVAARAVIALPGGAAYESYGLDSSLSRRRQGAERRGRAGMPSLYDAMLGCLETDPQKGLTLLGEARGLAVRLGERWWAPQMDHWRLNSSCTTSATFRPRSTWRSRDAGGAQAGVRAVSPARLSARGPDLRLPLHRSRGLAAT